MNLLTECLKMILEYSDDHKLDENDKDMIIDYLFDACMEFLDEMLANDKKLAMDKKISEIARTIYILKQQHWNKKPPCILNILGVHVVQSASKMHWVRTKCGLQCRYAHLWCTLLRAA